MQAETETLTRLASEAGGQFVGKLRADGANYVKLTDGAPGWVGDLVYRAHAGDPAPMLPDDWRYAWALEALDMIAEELDPETAGVDAEVEDMVDGFADRVADYTSELLAWLDSHSARSGYCDQAREEGYVEPEASIIDRIRAGQYLERREVFVLVLDALRKRAAELELEGAGEQA